MLVSNFVFATDYPELPQSSNYYAITTYSSDTILWLSNSLIKTQGTSSITYDVAKYKLINNSWSLLNNANGTLYAGGYNSILYANLDIYDELSGNLVFLMPLDHFQRGMAGALQKLLSTILPNLPIILGMLVLAIGLRKAYRVLSVSLKGA